MTKEVRPEQSVKSRLRRHKPEARKYCVLHPKHLDLAGHYRLHHAVCAVFRSDPPALVERLTAEEKEQLGKRCYRGRRNAAVSGSGLGLWIASTFIAANGCALYAESDGPNLGTTISLRLPTVSEDTPELLDALND